MVIVCRQGVEELVTEDPAASEQAEKKISCAYCLNAITTPESQRAINGSFTHVFANPHGYVYEIGCFSKAAGCRPYSTTSSDFSWFSGYNWQIAVCGQCASHLGWRFSSRTDTFYGLILEKLIFP
jgi:hypothetical protein